MFFIFSVVGCYINKLQFVEELRTNASSPGGDASPRRHCQLGARCPKLAILKVWIFMYLQVKASSLDLQMPTRGRVAPRLGRAPLQLGR